MTLRPQLLVGEGSCPARLRAAATRCAMAPGGGASAPGGEEAALEAGAAAGARGVPKGLPASGNAASRLGRASGPCAEQETAPSATASGQGGPLEMLTHPPL